MNETGVMPLGDRELIEAIRSGDRELFRELVERHSGTVFGIAWSRLGDRSLAEEAAQETFIKAYQTLGLLKQAEKFGAWLSAIARNVTINFGIRHRREMNKRARWQLEQTPAADEPADPDMADETIEQALAALTPVHREALVLFYLERKSIAEAAGVLGIRETAFKTRLHRARESMRFALEARLESSLEKLRPSSKFAAGVMLALPAQAPGAVAGGGIAAGIFKLLPFGWYMFLLQAAAIIPTVLLARWVGRKERENFADPQGFRARNFERTQRAAIWIVPLMMIAAFFVTAAVEPLGYKTVVPPILIGFALPYLIWSIRRAVLLRTGLSYSDVASAALFVIVLGGVYAELPFYLFYFAQALMLGTIFPTIGRLPMRMDYSLFLRAGAGLPDASDPRERQFSRAEILSFVRFLAERHLIMDWRSRSGVLQLKLTAVTPRLSGNFFPFLWIAPSTVALNGGGEARARLGRMDERDLRRLGFTEKATELTTRLEQNVAGALRAHAAGDMAGAEELLRQETNERIFRQAPSRAPGTRFRVWSFRICLGLTLIQGVFQYYDYYSGRRYSLRVVEMSDRELREAIETVLLRTNSMDLIVHGPFRSVKFPERRFFSDRAMAAFREILRERRQWYEMKKFAAPSTEFFLQDDVLHRAIYSGLVTREEFSGFQITLPAARAELASWTASRKNEYLPINPITVDHFSHTVLDTSKLNLRIHLLAAFNLLTNFAVEPVIAAIVDHQILPESPPDPRWQDLDTKALEGLFLMARSNPLRDTYDSLSILRTLGALDRIDREACIQGLLRRHLGRGLFKRPEDASQPWSFRASGHDTYCVIESLRMLNALDRVKEESWKFRGPRYRKDKIVPWELIEVAGLERRAASSLLKYWRRRDFREMRFTGAG